MQHEIAHGPSFSLLKLRLAPGESIHAEAGSMVTRSTDLSMRVKLNASRRAGLWGALVAFFVALMRKLVGGETFFVNEFSTAQGGELSLAPSLSGDILHRRMNGERLLLQAGAFLASTGDLDLGLRFGGLRTLLAREGLFLLEVTGTGDLFFTSYGAVTAIEVQDTYVVDTGHMVAFEGQLDFRIRSAGGGLLGFVASGEGLVCEFQGRGKVWIQSRNLRALVGWLVPYLP